MRSRNTLILFTKTPRICRVKTRMWPALSHQQCLYFHRQATQHLYTTLSNQSAFKLKIYTTEKYQRTASILPANVQLQTGIDLGERMYHAMQTELQSADRVIVIGSDCILMNADYVMNCFNKLDKQHDFVLGAANDGGYVLIGASHISKALFKNTQWGKESVLQSTSNNARKLGYNVCIAPTLIDADTMDDLLVMQKNNLLPNWAASLIRMS